MATLATLQKRLKETETAITRVQDGGQSYTIDGVTFSRANLKTLLSSRDDLERRILRKQGRGKRYSSFTFTGR